MRTGTGSSHHRFRCFTKRKIKEKIIIYLIFMKKIFDRADKTISVLSNVREKILTMC